MAVLVGVLLAALPAPPARAEGIDGGALSPGTQVTATFTDTDRLYTATVAVPAGRRLTLLAGAPTDAAQARSVSLTVLSSTSDRSPIGYSKTFGTEAGALRFVSSDVAAVDRVLTLQMSANRDGSLAFTPALITDVPPVAVGYGAPTPVSLAVPGQHATLTAPVVRGHKLGLRVTAVQLSDPQEQNFVWPDGYQLAVLRADGTPAWVSRVGNGVYQVDDADLGGTSKPLTIDVSGVGVATGSLTVEALDVDDISGTLVLGTPTTVTFSTPLSKADLTFTDVRGSRLSLQVTASTLVHADGTPGTATATLTNGAGSDDTFGPFGPVGAEPTTYYASGVSRSAQPQHLRLATDGASTGTVTLTLAATASPSATVTVGTPVQVSLPTPHASQTLLVPLEARTEYLLTVDHIDLRSAAHPDAKVQIRDFTTGPDYEATVIKPVRQGDTSVTTSLPTDSEARTLQLVIDPEQDVTGTFTVTVETTGPVTGTLVPGTPLTVTAKPMQDVVLAFPATTSGAPPVFRLTDVQVTATGQYTNLPAYLRQGDRENYLGDLGPGTTSATYQLDPRYGLDPAQPGTFVIRGGEGRTVKATVELVVPTVTTMAVRNGKPTLVSFTGPGQEKRLTFTPKTGQRVVVQRTGDAVGSTIGLLAADGTSPFYDQPDVWHPGYDEYSPVSPGGQLTLVVRAPLTATGTVSVSVTWVSDPVTHGPGPSVLHWTMGQNPKLVFPGKAGQRVTVQLTPRGTPEWSNARLHLVDAKGQDLEPYLLLGKTSDVLTFTRALPADGTYTLVLDPDGPASGAMTVRVLLSADAGATATPA